MVDVRSSQHHIIFKTVQAFSEIIKYTKVGVVDPEGRQQLLSLGQNLLFGTIFAMTRFLLTIA